MTHLLCLGFGVDYFGVLCFSHTHLCIREITSVVTNLEVSSCSCTTVPIRPDQWPCWLGQMGPVVHEQLESLGFMKIVLAHGVQNQSGILGS